jgi:hypothetical protein
MVENGGLEMRTRLIFALVVALSIPAVYGDNVTVISGGSVTLLDSGFTSTDFTSPFSNANFLAEETGTVASIESSDPHYIASLPSAPAAVWIGTNTTAGVNVGDTALYAISFNIPDPFSSASLNMFYAIDNELGGSNPGIYLNGIALPTSTGIGGFSSQFTYTDASVGGDLVQGTNWLFIDGVNLGGPAGLIFSADISTANSVPEPSSAWLLTGLLIAGAVSWRLRKRLDVGLSRVTVSRD